MGKIYIGECDRLKIINQYIKEHDNNDNKINHIYIIGEDMLLNVDLPTEFIKFSDTIMYKYYYRLLQEINANSLIILNECLRKTNRYDLTYNCIKKYLLQTPHRLIFNYFPIIKEQQDFMILYDMIQNNPFLRESYKYTTSFKGVEIGNVIFDVKKTDITVTDEQAEQYELEKEKIIAQVNKDPDIIPRRLLKYSEKIKPKGYDSLSKIKPIMNVAVSQLKVDQYYYSELMRFKEELNNVIQRIHE